MPNKNENNYKQKLIALCEGLECRNIPKLIKTATPEDFNTIGKLIAEVAKRRRSILSTDFLMEN